jgi:hypothetical protein
MKFERKKNAVQVVEHLNRIQFKFDCPDKGQSNYATSKGFKPQRHRTITPKI